MICTIQVGFPGHGYNTASVLLTSPVSILKPSQARQTSFSQSKTHEKLPSTRKSSRQVPTSVSPHTPSHKKPTFAALISAPRQGTPHLSKQAAAAFEKMIGAPLDASLTAESGAVVPTPELVNPTTTNVDHPTCLTGAAKGQVWYTVDVAPTTAPALIALSPTDPIYDADTSTDNNTDIFATKNGDSNEN